MLFGTVNLNDALLLASILSEDLDVLKGRGYEGQFGLLQPTVEGLIMQNTVDQVLQSSQYPNDSDLANAKSPCSPVAPEKPCIPFIGSVTQHMVPGADTDSMPECAGPTSNPPPIDKPAPGSPATSCEKSLTFTKVTNNVRDAFHVVTRSIMSGIGNAAILPPNDGSVYQGNNKHIISLNPFLQGSTSSYASRIHT